MLLLWPQLALQQGPRLVIQRLPRLIHSRQLGQHVAASHKDALLLLGGEVQQASQGAPLALVLPPSQCAAPADARCQDWVMYSPALVKALPARAALIVILG